MSELFLVCGLGNPGRQYARTRHNAGFLVLDALAAKLGVSFNAWQTSGEYVKVSFAGREVLLAKPLTYMNLSGQMVHSLARFYKVSPANMLVCFDDVTLEVGQLRIRKNGSAGGQKGMKNIIELFGTQEIARLRVGVGPKPEKFDLADFVLSNFSKSEEPALQTALDHAVEAVELILTSGLEKAQTRFN